MRLESCQNHVDCRIRQANICYHARMNLWFLKIVEIFVFADRHNLLHLNPSLDDFFQDKYGDLYSAENLAISGIHTHAAPAGYLQYVVYQITSMGFVKQTYDAMVEGIVKVLATTYVMESRVILVSWCVVFKKSSTIHQSSLSLVPTAPIPLFLHSTLFRK